MSALHGQRRVVGSLVSCHQASKARSLGVLPLRPPARHLRAPSSILVPATSAADRIVLRVSDLAKETTGREQGPHDDEEFKIRFGKAIRVLREDLPAFFNRSLDPEIYDPSIQLQSPWISCKQLKTYLFIQTLLRFVARIMFSNSQLQIMRLWSPSDGVLRARCKVIAEPWGASLLVKLLKLMHIVNSPTRPKSPTPGELLTSSTNDDNPQERDMGKQDFKDVQWQYDLLFTYKFTSKGFIYIHTVDRVQPLDSYKAVEAAAMRRRMAPASMTPPPPAAAVPPPSKTIRHNSFNRSI